MISSVALLVLQCAVATPRTWLTYGDSKTISGTYQTTLAAAMRAKYPYEPLYFQITTPVSPGIIARNGATVASMKLLVDDDLAATSKQVQGDLVRVLLNLGANDVASMPLEADFKSDLGYILDALHTKFPSAQVWLMQTWRKNYAAESNTLAGWRVAVVAARSTWAFIGPDERVFLEAGDDGATYTSDGIHPNAAGYALTAAQWQSALGY